MCSVYKKCSRHFTKNDNADPSMISGIYLVIEYSSFRSLWQRSKNSEFCEFPPKVVQYLGKSNRNVKRLLKFHRNIAWIEMSGLFQRLSTLENLLQQSKCFTQSRISCKEFETLDRNRFPSKQAVGSHKVGFLGNAHSSWVANWTGKGKNNFRLWRNKKSSGVSLAFFHWISFGWLVLGRALSQTHLSQLRLRQSSAPNMCLPLASLPQGPFT